MSSDYNRSGKENLIGFHSAFKYLDIFLYLVNIIFRINLVNILFLAEKVLNTNGPLLFCNTNGPLIMYVNNGDEFIL